MTKPLEAIIIEKGEVFGIKPDVEKVLMLLAEDDSRLKTSVIVEDGDSLKLVFPTGIETGDEVDRYCLLMAISKGDFKNTRGLDEKVDKILSEDGYDEEMSGLIRPICVERYTAYYTEHSKSQVEEPTAKDKIAKRLEDSKTKVLDIFKRGGGNTQTVKEPWVEAFAMMPARSVSFLTERGRAAMERVNNENLERVELAAMLNNDLARIKYLSTQASEALASLNGLGIKDEWAKYYEKTMIKKYGEGNYPALGSAEGLEKFFIEVYQPVLALVLSSAEIASVMGDHAATKVTAELEAEMNIILANKRAEVAEAVQPAQRRVDNEVMKTRSNEANLYVVNEERFSRSKKIKNNLAAKTVLSPISSVVSESVEAVSEAGPAFLKGFAEFFKRWQDQEGGDPILVGVTAGGLSAGLVGGVLAVMFFGGSWLMIPAGAVILPLASASGYMAFRGFTESDGSGKGKK